MCRNMVQVNRKLGGPASNRGFFGDKREQQMMRRTWHVLSAVSLALAVAAAGCEGTKGGGVSAKAPNEVVKAGYMAANAGQYSEADKYLSSPGLNLVKREMGGTKNLWDQVTRSGTIDKIEILKEEVRGEGAKVYLRTHFKDGQTLKDSVPLIKETGEWKIAPG